MPTRRVGSKEEKNTGALPARGKHLRGDDYNVPPSEARGWGATHAVHDRSRERGCDGFVPVDGDGFAAIAGRFFAGEGETPRGASAYGANFIPRLLVLAVLIIELCVS